MPSRALHPHWVNTDILNFSFLIFNYFPMSQTRVFTSDAPESVGQTVTLKGWVHAKRNMGQIVFIDLRDGFGMVQVVFGDNPELQAQANSLKPESVVSVTGKVVERGGKNVNAKIATGKIEIQATELEVLNEAVTPPFEIDRENVEDEELRLKYRYLDLRHDRLHQNLIMRHKVISFIRTFLNDRQFTEIETPLITAATPEGARDYLVPSRKYQGSFYALPQSPQQYKQLLMVANFERYYQIAKCMRDEDSRGDRQPEFTQLDLEMSFVDQDEILNLTEELFTQLITTLYPDKIITQTPWPRITYQESMEKYGTDKPDLRKDKNNPNELALGFIVDFPLFGKEDGHLTPEHHMFTAPKPDQIDLLDTTPEKVISTSYDMVLNGYEMASGSIRIHQPELQQKILDIIGIDRAEAEQKFGHMLEAFKYGAPPHGGIAPGIDRFMMILQNEPNIREVIAFPKTNKGRDPMMGSPREVDSNTLNELGLELRKKK